jgi:hypothetical protein
VADDLVLARVSGLLRANRRAITQHGDAVGDAEDLVELVGDVDAGDAAFPQIAQDVEQDQHLVLGQRGGGFVENEDLRVLGERLDDLDELLLPHAERAHRRGRIEIDLETIQQRLRLAIHARPVDEGSPAAWFAAEEDVFRHRHLLHERQFLINHREPGLLRVFDRFKACLDAIHLKAAFVAAMRMNAGEQLDERALARAVFTAQRVDFALAEVKRHILKRGDAGEALGDVVGAEDR